MTDEDNKTVYFKNYTTPWEPYSLNRTFWDEVLVGKTITSVEFDDEKVSCLVLDNGERLFFDGGVPYIKDKVKEIM